MKMGKTHFGLQMDSEVTAAFLERFLVIFTKLRQHVQIFANLKMFQRLKCLKCCNQIVRKKLVERKCVRGSENLRRHGSDVSL